MEGTLKISQKRKVVSNYLNVLIAIGSAFAFLLSIHLMGLAFNTLGKDAAASILQITSNPFIGLFIGLLITALLQSSSTTTSMVVAAVASGSISLTSAIPIVIGANVGTTITSTIVSLSFMTKTNEFRRAIAAGTSHDIFNIFCVLLLFPLELKYQFLTNASTALGRLFNDSSSSFQGFVNREIDVFTPIGTTLLDWVGPIILLVFSVVMLFVIVKYISAIFYRKLIGNTRKSLDDLVFGSKTKSFSWGFLLTGLVQSSSLTTSLIVPFVATGKVHLKKAFPFILGANLGTTITAIIASTLKSEAAVSIALAHFLFNLFGVTLFLLIPAINRVPIMIGKKIGQLSTRFRLVGFVYVLLVFFVLPFSLIYLSNNKNWISKSQATQPVETLVDK